MKATKTILGVVVGLAIYYALAWALYNSALVHAFFGAGVLLWFVGGCIGGFVLTLVWLRSMFKA